MDCVFWVFELLLKISILFRFLGVFWLLSESSFRKKTIFFSFLLNCGVWLFVGNLIWGFVFVFVRVSLCDLVHLWCCWCWTRLQNAMCGIRFLISVLEHFAKIQRSFFVLLMWYSWITVLGNLEFDCLSEVFWLFSESEFRKISYFELMRLVICAASESGVSVRMVWFICVIGALNLIVPKAVSLNWCVWFLVTNEYLGFLCVRFDSKEFDCEMFF